MRRSRESFELRGEARYHNGSYLDALALYQAALDVEETSSGHIFLAKTFSMLNNQHEALVHYQHALEIEPNVNLKIPLLLVVGDLLLSAGNHDLAIDAYQELIRLGKHLPRDFVQAQLRLAECRKQTEDYEKVVSHYRAAIEHVEDLDQVAEVSFLRQLDSCCMHHMNAY